MDDPHAEARDRKRRKKRYGPTMSNPGLRIVMRDLARKAHEGSPPADSGTDEGAEAQRGTRGRHTRHSRREDDEPGRTGER